MKLTVVATVCLVKTLLTKTKTYCLLHVEQFQSCRNNKHGLDENVEQFEQKTSKWVGNGFYGFWST